MIITIVLQCLIRAGHDHHYYFAMLKEPDMIITIVLQCLIRARHYHHYCFAMLNKSQT